MEKRLNEIKERKAAILAELADADERVAELNTEVDELTAEEAQIRSKMDLAGKLGTPAEAAGQKTTRPRSAARNSWKNAL